MTAECKSTDGPRAREVSEKFQKELRKKKVALFVSSDAQALIEHEGKQ